MTTGAASLDQINLLNAGAYAERGYPWEEWALLRREAPVYWYERAGVEPFWAITRYRDIQRISRDPETFSSDVQLFVAESDGEAETTPGATALDADEADEGSGTQLMINMDPPEHGRYRGYVNRRFSPRGMRIVEERIEAIAAEVVERAAARLVDDVARRGRIDFVTEVAARLPLAAIGEMLGVPRERWGDMFLWTNQVVGAADPEYQEGRTSSETSSEANRKLMEYFAQLADEKRQHPADDLMTTIVQAEFEGQPLPVEDVIGYGFLLIIAGNETTRNATSGGMLALLEHPEQLRRLRADPGLLESAVEEILRWTSPVTHMARRVSATRRSAGRRSRRGRRWCCGTRRRTATRRYSSGLRSSTSHASPTSISPSGASASTFCLGANLARLELRAIFRQLLSRMDEIELDGEVERLRSGIVGGIKHLPISFTVRPVAVGVPERIGTGG